MRPQESGVAAGGPEAWHVGLDAAAARGKESWHAPCLNFCVDTGTEAAQE
jgi:hypothetical protein